ncbi:hypothetical protein [Amycolatopsis plumensis]
MRKPTYPIATTHARNERSLPHRNGVKTQGRQGKPVLRQRRTGA